MIKIAVAFSLRRFSRYLIRGAQKLKRSRLVIRRSRTIRFIFGWPKTPDCFASRASTPRSFFFAAVRWRRKRWWPAILRSSISARSCRRAFKGHDVALSRRRRTLTTIRWWRGPPSARLSNSKANGSASAASVRRRTMPRSSCSRRFNLKPAKTCRWWLPVRRPTAWRGGGRPDRRNDSHSIRIAARA